jgi:hypothetical protein
MKHYIFILLTFLFINISQAKPNNDAIEYNDKIVTEQTKIGNQILAFSEAPTDESLAVLQKQATTSLAVLNEMKPFEKNAELLNTAKVLFQFYINVTNNEYAKILDLFKNSTKYKQEELIEKINVYVAAIGAKEKNIDQNFSVAQNTFAKKFGFTLTENKLQREIDSVNNKQE